MCIGLIHVNFKKINKIKIYQNTDSKYVREDWDLLRIRHQDGIMHVGDLLGKHLCRKKGRRSGSWNGAPSDSNAGLRPVKRQVKNGGYVVRASDCRTALRKAQPDQCVASEHI